MAFQERLRGSRSSVEKLSSETAQGGNNAWLDVHYDLVASLYTFSNCMALEDYNLDGDHEFLVADLGSGYSDMKLKAYQGTELVHQTPLLYIPTALCTFYIDSTEPRTPAIAVASGSYIYMYKNLHPYFKFTLPGLQINTNEAEVWEQAKQDNIDATELRQVLASMNEEIKRIPLTERSLRFLQLDAEDLLTFVKIVKHMPLKRQTTITCMCTMKKNLVDNDAVSCLVVGTEDSNIYILDPLAFIVLVKISVPAVPVFLRVTGLYEVSYQVSVACRDSHVYTIEEGDKTPKFRISLGSQPCGMQKRERNILVACMDQTLSCYSIKGLRLWVHQLPAPVTELELMDYQPQGLKAVIVCLRNCEVRLYREKYLINSFQVDDVVVGLKFGRYGREDGSMLMVTQGGSLIIKILKRTASLDGKETKLHGPTKAQSMKLNLPKKTKIIVDQTLREREQFAAMHNIFQRDLFRLKLETARSYAKAISSSMIPITSSQPNENLKIYAQIQGLGPVFQLTVNLFNSSSTFSLRELGITFRCDESLHRIHRKFIQVPMLLCQLDYKFVTTVESLDDLGRSEDISVFVLKRGHPKPLITAVIKMPLSENITV